MGICYALLLNELCVAPAIMSLFAMAFMLETEFSRRTEFSEPGKGMEWRIISKYGIVNIRSRSGVAEDSRNELQDRRCYYCLKCFK